jgi:hypothetical protein
MHAKQRKEGRRSINADTPTQSYGNALELRNSASLIWGFQGAVFVMLWSVYAP